MSRAAALVAAVALVLLSTFLVRDHTRDDSLSADEPVHILSGWQEVAGRSAAVNIEHPPLAKILVGLALQTVLQSLIAVYAPVTSRMTPQDQRGAIHEMVAMRGAPGLSAAIESLVSVSPPLAHYAGGLASVLRVSGVGQGLNYFGGKTSLRGFPSYFFVAFALKSTLAFLAVTLTSLFFFFRRPGEFREEGRLFLLPVAVLFLASIFSAYNIGVRHILPVYPFLALAGGAVFARITAASSADGRSGIAVTALALLPVLSAYELLRIHPHELSYFNAIAGGPERGRWILSDSNVDWGLDLKRLARELARRRVSDPTIFYFGGDAVPARAGVPNFLTEPRVRGSLVAVSAFYLALGPGLVEQHAANPLATPVRNLLAEIRTRGRPAGRVGYSIYLFELPPRDKRQGERSTG